MNLSKIAVGASLILALSVGLPHLILNQSHLQEQRAGAESIPVSDNLGFPFEILNEEFLEYNWRWEARIYLEKDYLNIENLSKLFRWYSHKHPSVRQAIIAEVYTDKEKVPTQRLWDYEPTSTGRTPRGSVNLSLPYEAVFTREGKEFLSPGRDNESFIYKPNLADNDQSAIIVLKGAIHQRRKEAYETIVLTGASFNVRITAYSLPGVIPSAFYYDLDAVDKDTGKWLNIMTYRFDKQATNLRDQVHFISNQVGYVFLGNLYAVTVDGGKIWTRWDAEYDLPGWQCCNSSLIRDVSVTLDGTGTMMVNTNSQQQ